MSSEIAIRLRDRIARARKAAGLTQVEVEAKLRLPVGAVSKIEAGAREISSTELVELAAVLGRSVGSFFGPESDASVHFRGDVTADESRRDLSWFQEFATSYRSLAKRVGD
jgi:transcriptional regulator with XRE-family HTH domain